jgi:hypothetical protein
MLRFPRMSRPLLIIGILAVPGRATADVIHIMSGALASRSSNIAVVDATMASPEHGFSLRATGNFNGGVYDLYGFCVLGSACAPGQVLSLEASWLGSDFPGTATADGITVVLATASEFTAEALVDFKGTWTTPPFTGATTTSVVAPFAFSGLIDYPDAFPRRSDTLVGSGLTTIHLAWNTRADEWLYTGARYQFAATPEPATLLLAAPCALGLARRWSVRRAVRT